jgi:hypothetical protein
MGIPLMWLGWPVRTPSVVVAGCLAATGLVVALAVWRAEPDVPAARARARHATFRRPAAQRPRSHRTAREPTAPEPTAPEHTNEEVP